MSDDNNSWIDNLGDEIDRDLKEVWASLSEEKEQAMDVQEIKRSKHPVQHLRRQMGLKTLYFALGIVAIIIMRFATQNDLSRTLMDIVIVSFIICGVYIAVVWQRLPRWIDPELNVRSTLKSAYRRTKLALRIEEGMGLFLYPIAAAAGMLWGRELRDPSLAVDQDIDWMILLMVVVVVTPLSHFAAVWMNKWAFGKYLKRLERMLSQYSEK
ncbi:hypothetical protein HZ996_06360 [Cryomorphaceae bacterium]|nr:hypothetical protein HZ996_06360 [Cryomorphaceae bacterium]